MRRAAIRTETGKLTLELLPDASRCPSLVGILVVPRVTRQVTPCRDRTQTGAQTTTATIQDLPKIQTVLALRGTIRQGMATKVTIP
jgi:hypothetical protein